MSFLQIARSCLTKPEFWVLTGTTLPPINVCWAIGFFVMGKLRRSPNLPIRARSLNIQITYTALLAVSLLCGQAMARWKFAHQLFAPGSESALAAGLTLGVIGALSLLALVFFNTREFTESVLGHKRTFVPRFRVFRE